MSLDDTRLVPLAAGFIHGAVSVERTACGGFKPWRIPYERKELFPPNALNGTAETAAGVRIVFRSDTHFVTLRFAPFEKDVQFVCRAEPDYCRVFTISKGESEAFFAGLPDGERKIVIYCPQNSPVVWRSLIVSAQASAVPVAPSGPAWITYGSSITQSASLAVTPLPTEAWPVRAADAAGFELTCLGYGGNCHHEPMVARMIAELPANIISLCFGINVYGGNSLNVRTFQASVIGFIRTLRDKHPNIPIAAMSPIFAQQRETTRNAAGLDLQTMRSEIEEAVRVLRRHGDSQLHYISGLELLDESRSHLLPDGLHPDADGNKIMAERFVHKLDSLGLLRDTSKKADESK